MNKNKQVFEMLGIEADEEFTISISSINTVYEKYKISKELVVLGYSPDGNWRPSRFNIGQILNGEILIKKIKYSEKCLSCFNDMPFKISDFAFYIKDGEVVRSKIVGVSLDKDGVWIEFEVKDRFYEIEAIDVDSCFQTKRAAELALKESEQNEM